MQKHPQYEQGTNYHADRKGETSDKVSALEFGADDYIVKPFIKTYGVRAVLLAVDKENTKAEITYDKLKINLGNYTITLNGQVQSAA